MSYKWIPNRAINAKIQSGVDAGLTAIGIAVETEAVNNLNEKVYAYDPVSYKLTGKLKQTLNYRVGKNKVTIGSPMKYAPYVEYPGKTRKFKGKPFLRPAYDKVKLIAKLILANEIRKKL